MTARKRWFKCADSILHEAWTRDQKTTLVMLMAYLNTRWAREGLTAEEAGQATLDRGAMLSITGRSRMDSARVSLGYLEGIVGLRVGYVNGSVTINWPKFPLFQEYPNRSQADGRPLPSAYASSGESKKERQERASGVAKPPPTKLKMGGKSPPEKIPEPDAFEANTPEAAFCRAFHERLQGVNGKLYRAPTASSRRTWVLEAKRLLKAAGAKEAALVVEWLFSSPQGEFWRANIFSIPTFRKQFLRLTAQSKRKPPMTAMERNLEEIHAAYGDPEK